MNVMNLSEIAAVTGGSDVAWVGIGAGVGLGMGLLCAATFIVFVDDLKTSKLAALALGGLSGCAAGLVVVASIDAYESNR